MILFLSSVENVKYDKNLMNHNYLSFIWNCIC